MSEKQPAVLMEGVGIEFQKSGLQNGGRLKARPFPILSRRAVRRSFWALKEVSLRVEKGDLVGVIGNNGAGKSTLLRIVAGVLPQDVGRLEVNGQATSLLQAGAGFQVQLTGRENVFLSGCLMGYSRKRIKDLFNQVVAFAELEDFIETPVRYYSTGMRTRLGFSLAVHLDPDILIVDEVIRTGDKNFRKKSQEKMIDLLGRANTIILASHDTDFITDLCNKAVWLERGLVRKFGPAGEVVESYLRS
jgi:ABC-type polysaccharide/polyol phosphate transport system ATPase subunit